MPERDESGPHSQTLDRGIRVLELLAEAERPIPVSALASALGVHRSIVYRFVRTLEDHRLVTRRADGYELGMGLPVLARNVSKDLRDAALPELAAVAEELGMTCFLVVPDRGECVTLLSVEPRHTAVAVASRPGSRHPTHRGAPGLALLAAGPPLDDERPEVAAARARGYATSANEVITGLRSVSVPVVPRGSGVDGALAAVAVVFVDTVFGAPEIADRLRAAARTIADAA